MTRRRFLVFSAAAVLVGCRRGSGTTTPPTIRYGRDVCAQCGMIISDARFAAAATAADGSSLVFDDIGDLLAYQRAHAPEWVVVWVHDYETEEWLRAEEAWYLLGGEVHSPMGWGIAAFADEESARARQSELGGELLRWEELRSRELTHPGSR